MDTIGNLNPSLGISTEDNLQARLASAPGNMSGGSFSGGAAQPITNADLPIHHVATKSVGKVDSLSTGQIVSCLI